MVLILKRNVLRDIIFGSDVSREPYESLGPLFITHFETKITACAGAAGACAGACDGACVEQEHMF